MKRTFSILLVVIMMILTVNIMPVADNKTNIAENMSYIITTGEPVENSHMNYAEGEYHNDNGNMLTDGKSAGTDRGSANWYKAMRGGSRIVEFDFGENVAVSGFSAGFFHFVQMAVYAPRYLNVFLSGDGENYQLVGEYKPDFELSDKAERRADFNEEFGTVYSARYVRIEFCVDIFAYCDEIKIFGSKTLSGAETAILPGDPAEDKGYLTDMNGINSIIKIYNGYYSADQERSDNTKEELIPYIAYLDKNGNISDTMFDCVAFVPCHGEYPSGGWLIKRRDTTGAVMSDWLTYLEYTFREEYDLYALNEAVEQVGNELEWDEKYPVMLTIPYPVIIDGEFGDIDGDGAAEGCATFEERAAICEWFTDLCIERFAQAGLDNLRLEGFYWYREEVNYYESNHEAELVKTVAAMVKSRGYSILYDPFYLSTGYDHWEELGFTAAVMQPNVAFYDQYDYFEREMLEEFAQTVKKHGLGVEIETPEPGLFSDSGYEKAGLYYESYLYYGWKTGYMNALKTFYQGAGPGTIYSFCFADISTEKGAYLRSLYEDTFKFLKGTYEVTIPSITIDDFVTVAGQRNVRIDIDMEEGFDRTRYTIEFVDHPAHGSAFVLQGNTVLVYSADKDYEGEDSFTLRVTNGFEQGELVSVKVSVVAPEEENSSVQSQSKTDPGEKRAKAPLMLIIAGTAICIGAIGFVIFRIVKRKK